MKHKTLLGAVFVLALVLAACAPATASPTAFPTVMEPTMTEAPTGAPTSATGEATSATTATSEPSMTGTAMAGTGTPSMMETPTGGIPVTGEATVQVSNSTDHGSILTDGNGMALYVFMNDTQNSGTSACSDTTCTSQWTPLESQGSPAAGDGVDASKLGTITRDDGTMQVTYNGWPLYLYTGDSAAGDTNGQGMNSMWYLVSPDGTAIQQ